MKKVTDKSIIGLRCFCIAVWAAVILCVVCLCGKVYATNKVPTESPKITAPVVDEEIKKIPTVLEKSMDICSMNISSDIAYAVNGASTRHKVPHFVIYAIIATESGKARTEEITPTNLMTVNYKANSCCNCKGLMQVSTYAVQDYNKTFGTKYTLDDMYNIGLNIEVGTWYFSQFKSVATSWTEMYVIYNVGYSRYNRVNPYWFYGWDGKWYNNYRNSFFFMNNMMPPDESCNKGLYGKNKLPTYRPKARFEKCLNLCYQHFNN